MRAALALVAVFALATGQPVLAGQPLAVAPALADQPTATPPAITATLPNPVADGDTGEAVVLRVGANHSLGDLSLSDGERTVALPNRTITGRVVLTGNESALPSAIDGPVVELDSAPALANSGERLTLNAGNYTLDTLSYEDAPEGELASAGPDGLTWRPLGATDREPLTGGPADVRAFTLPDAPGIPLGTLRSADRRLLLAGYTLTDDRAVDALVAAQRRGVDVRVLLDGSPVGGLTNRSAAALDRLVAANVSVAVMDGRRAPYRFHHPKYAVVDDRALVTTENWKPAGTGGRASRGWGVVVADSPVVAGLAETFHADARKRNTVPWTQARQNETFEPAPPASGSYATRFEPVRRRAERVELLLAPDNAAGRVERLLSNATDSIRILQVSVGGLDNRLLQASIDAARRGVAVDLLLSRAWYTVEENRALAHNLTRLAEREGLPLSVRLAEPNGRFEKVHAKGVIVDGEHVLVGSLNWNDNAFENNREVALLVTGESVAAYYGRVFEADWQGGVWALTTGLVVAVAVAALLAVVVGRRIEFDGG